MWHYSSFACKCNLLSYLTISIYADAPFLLAQCKSSSSSLRLDFCLDQRRLIWFVVVIVSFKNVGNI